MSMSIPPSYLKLGKYCDTSFGLLQFNPPLATPLPFPYERKNDPVITYEFSYNSLMGKPKSPDSVNNTPYASINQAY